MRKQKRSLLFLLLGLLSLGLLAWIVVSFPPTMQIPQLQIPIFYIFFVLFFSFLFFSGTFIFASKKHGLFICLFGVAFLVFRLNNLTHPLFVILLVGLFLTLDLLFSYRK